MIYPQKPYLSWKVNEKDFPRNGNFFDQAKFILNYASLAPSTFNSQPWKCQIKEGEIEVYLDLTRVTQMSDKVGRFAHISMGCFLQNLLVAAEYFGFKTKMELFDRRQDNLKLIAIVTLQPGQAKPSDKELFEAIKERATNRSLSLEKKVPEKVIHKIKDHVLSGQKLVVFGEDSRNEIVNISLTGDKDIWTDFKFRKEHVGWVRHNLTQALDGMPGFGVGVPLIPSFLAYPAILSPIFPVIQSKKNIKALLSTKNFMVLCSKDDEKEWVKLGILYERIGLIATSEGMVVAPMGQFTESDTARKMLTAITKKDASLSPQIFFRVGYPSKSVHHSPRLPVKHFLIK